MPWSETEENNRNLLEALSTLAGEKGALERLAGALNACPSAVSTNKARMGTAHSRNATLITSSTLVRWQQEGLERVRNAQSHKKRLVFEFLERAPDFQTNLYRPGGQLPSGLLAYAAENAVRLAQPLAKDLSKLDGAFEVFRPAWTTPARRDRVLVSRLLFRTSGGFTRFREEQDYIDDAYHDAHILEADEGAVMFTAANLVLFGFGVNAERVKLYVADTWQDALNGPLPIIRLSGTMMGISGRRENPSFPFVAFRSKKPFAEIETAVLPASDPRFDEEVLSALSIA